MSDDIVDDDGAKILQATTDVFAACGAVLATATKLAALPSVQNGSSQSVGSDVIRVVVEAISSYVDEWSSELRALIDGSRTFEVKWLEHAWHQLNDILPQTHAERDAGSEIVDKMSKVLAFPVITVK